MSAATQLVLYTNDAVTVSFLDGSTLHLSPCGASFSYHPPPTVEQHPLQGRHAITQRCRFVTSEYKLKVLCALEFRNRFASRPYLCHELIPHNELLSVHTDTSEVYWQIDGGATRLPSDGIQVVSADEFASLFLSANRHDFSVRYLSRISTSQPRKKQPSPVIENRLNGSFMSEVSDMPIMDGSYCETLFPTEQGKQSVRTKVRRSDGHNKTSTPNQVHETLQFHLSTICATPGEGDHVTDERSRRWDNVWICQHHSVADAPSCWSHPLKLALEEAEKDELDESKHVLSVEPVVISSNKQKLDKSRCQVCKTPKSLPLNCEFPNLHKWPSQHDPTGLGKVKVVCSSGVVYRLVRGSGPCIEVYPGDGSVIRSHGEAGKFFIHHFNKMKDRMYAVKSPPPDTPGSSYSVSRLVNTAAGLLYQISQDNLELLKQDPPCWQQKSESPEPLARSPSVIKEECSVPGLGRFSASSNDHIRVVFDDRTCLDMAALSPTQQGVPASQLLNIPADSCRLLLPSGRYKITSLEDAQYQRYIKAALHWAEWVRSSPDERIDFYKDTIYDPLRQSFISNELEKIQCFNYIVDNTAALSGETTWSPPPTDGQFQYSPPGGTTSLTPESVKESLQKTASFIDDIEKLLARSKQRPTT